MDTLKDKVYKSYEYLSRYSNVPEYYDTLENRECPGIGTNMFTNTGAVTHLLKETDTLDSLALKYYNNPAYWWVIAYYNNIQDSFIKLIDHFTVLQIPNIANIKFGYQN